MMQRSIWRVLLSMLVSAMGGLGMANTIFPMFVIRFMERIPLEVLINVRDAGLAIALLWAIGGAIVGWLGGVRTGALVIGLCGLIAGYWLGVIAAGGNGLLLLWGAAAGLLYGIPGGLIMGRVFPKPAGEVR